MAGYSGTPLVRKLGITEDANVLLDGAPAGFALEDVPPGAEVRTRLGPGPYDVIVCFCPDHARLSQRWPVLHPRTTSAGSLWIAWPKRASGRAIDLDDNVVREFGLAHGRVDVKVCAIDEVWSGSKYVIRKAER